MLFQSPGLAFVPEIPPIQCVHGKKFLTNSA